MCLSFWFLFSVRRSNYWAFSFSNLLMHLKKNFMNVLSWKVIIPLSRWKIHHFYRVTFRNKTGIKNDTKLHSQNNVTIYSHEIYESGPFNHQVTTKISKHLWMDGQMSKQIKLLSMPRNKSKGNTKLKMQKQWPKRIKSKPNYIATTLQCSRSRCTIYISKFGKCYNNEIKKPWFSLQIL